MSKNNDSIFGDHRSSLGDELRRYLELYGYKPTKQAMYKIEKEYRTEFKRDGSGFKYLYSLVENSAGFKAEVANQTKPYEFQNKPNAYQPRNYVHEKISTVMRMQDISYEEAEIYLANKNAEKEAKRLEREKTIEAKMIFRKVYVEKDGVTLEFKNLKSAIDWYMNLDGFYSFSGVKGMIHKWLKDGRENHLGYRFWRNQE